MDETKKTKGIATDESGTVVQETPPPNGNGKSYADGNHAAVEATGKTAEELALENAHAELIATARMCAKMSAPKVVKGVSQERKLTRHIIESLGGAAIEALAGYFDAHKAFELSVR